MTPKQMSILGLVLSILQIPFFYWFAQSEILLFGGFWLYLLMGFFPILSILLILLNRYAIKENQKLYASEKGKTKLFAQIGIALSGIMLTAGTILLALLVIFETHT